MYSRRGHCEYFQRIAKSKAILGVQCCQLMTKLFGQKMCTLEKYPTNLQKSLVSFMHFFVKYK
jgi:hypothetical protein